MTAMKRGLYSLKVVLKYAAGWSSLYLFVMLLSSLLSPAQIYFMESLIDTLTTGAGYGKVLLFGVALVSTIILGNLFSLLNGFFTTMISLSLNRNQTPVTLEKFRNTEYACFEDKENQNMLQKIAGNPSSDILSVFTAMISIVYSFVSVIGILLMFFRASYVLGIAAILTMIPMFILESTSANKEMKLRWNMTTDIRKRYYLQQLFVDKNALQEIKLFRAKQKLIDMSDDLTLKINKDMEKTLKKVMLLSLLSSIFILVFTGASLVLLSVSLAKAMITLGVFVSLITSLSTFYGTVRGSVSTVANFLRLSYNIKYYQDFMALPERTKQKDQDQNIFGKEIVFSHVDFRYPTGKKDVLRDVNMTIRAGQRIAFVGENGAGKTTIIKLLLGLYKPTAGKITIDGMDINDISDEERRKIFSVIFQDYQDYQLSLRENVAFGCIGKLHDDKAIKKALTDAGADHIMTMNEKGLDLNLGKVFEDGLDVSGGQWQRIAMARAYLSDSSFIIMDEPTAALDPLAESEMYSQFANVLSKRGAIMISHRLASAKMADTIYVLSEGTVKEAGTHEELLENKSIYADMWDKQSSWYQVKEAT